MRRVQNKPWPIHWASPVVYFAYVMKNSEKFTTAIKFLLFGYFELLVLAFNLNIVIAVVWVEIMA